MAITHTLVPRTIKNKPAAQGIWLARACTQGMHAYVTSMVMLQKGQRKKRRKHMASCIAAFALGTFRSQLPHTCISQSPCRQTGSHVCNLVVAAAHAHVANMLHTNMITGLESNVLSSIFLLHADCDCMHAAESQLRSPRGVSQLYACFTVKHTARLVVITWSILSA
jgi:hypothetical protein